MRSIVLSFCISAAACTSGDTLNLDIKEGTAPTDDTAEPDSDDPDDPDDTDADPTKAWGFSGAFTLGPEGVEPFCSGKMIGVLEFDQGFTSDGGCVIDKGPGQGQELEFLIEGQFNGEEFEGWTYLIEQGTEIFFETGGTYDVENGTVELEWMILISGPNGSQAEVFGLVEMDKD